MCGRFSQAYTFAEIVAFSQPLTVPVDRPNLQARYNITPTTDCRHPGPDRRGPRVVESPLGADPGLVEEIGEGDGLDLQCAHRGRRQ